MCRHTFLERWGFVRLCVLIALLGGSCLSGNANAQKATSPTSLQSQADPQMPMPEDAIKMALHGENITEKSAALLERQVKKEPNSVRSRITLLGFYFLRRASSETARTACRKHIAWMIRHQPSAEFTGTAFCCPLPILENDTYLEGKSLWQEQIQKLPGNVRVLQNAAHFVASFDKELAQDYLRSVQKVDPGNTDALLEIAVAAFTRMETLSGAERKAAVEQNLIACEKALSVVKSESERTYLSRYLLMAAYEAEQWEKVRSCALALLAYGKKHLQARDAGDAIFYGNLMLGRLALRQGDVEQAKTYLLEAGNAPAKGILTSFGPNMILAQDLLMKGEKASVRAFLTQCTKFWGGPGPQLLQNWLSEMDRGLNPDFSLFVVPASLEH